MCIPTHPHTCTESGKASTCTLTCSLPQLGPFVEDPDEAPAWAVEAIWEVNQDGRSLCFSLSL